MINLKLVTDKPFVHTDLKISLHEHVGSVMCTVYDELGEPIFTFQEHGNREVFEEIAYILINNKKSILNVLNGGEPSE